MLLQAQLTQVQWLMHPGGQRKQDRKVALCFSRHYIPGTSMHGHEQGQRPVLYGDSYGWKAISRPLGHNIAQGKSGPDRVAVWRGELFWI